MNLRIIELFAVIVLAASILVIVCQAKKKSSFHSLKTSPPEGSPRNKENIDDATGCKDSGCKYCASITNDVAQNYNYPIGSKTCGKSKGDGHDGGCMDWWLNASEHGEGGAYKDAFDNCLGVNKYEIDNATGCGGSGKCKSCADITDDKAWNYTYPSDSNTCKSGPDGCIDEWGLDIGMGFKYQNALGMCEWTVGNQPCYADYGAVKGDSQCCGKADTVHNSEKVCPSIKPICQASPSNKLGECVTYPSYMSKCESEPLSLTSTGSTSGRLKPNQTCSQATSMKCCSEICRTTEAFPDIKVCGCIYGNGGCKQSRECCSGVCKDGTCLGGGEPVYCSGGLLSPPLIQIVINKVITTLVLPAIMDLVNKANNSQGELLHGPSNPNYPHGCGKQTIVQGAACGPKWLPGKPPGSGPGSISQKMAPWETIGLQYGSVADAEQHCIFENHCNGLQKCSRRCMGFTYNPKEYIDDAAGCVEVSGCTAKGGKCKKGGCCSGLICEGPGSVAPDENYCVDPPLHTENIDDATGSGCKSCGAITNDVAQNYNYPIGSKACGKAKGDGREGGCTDWWYFNGGKYQDAFDICLAGKPKWNSTYLLNQMLLKNPHWTDTANEFVTTPAAGYNCHILNFNCNNPLGCKQYCPYMNYVGGVHFPINEIAFTIDTISKIKLSNGTWNSTCINEYLVFGKVNVAGKIKLTIKGQLNMSRLKAVMNDPLEKMNFDTSGTIGWQADTIISMDLLFNKTNQCFHNPNVQKLDFEFPPSAFKVGPFKFGWGPLDNNLIQIITNILKNVIYDNIIPLIRDDLKTWIVPQIEKITTCPLLPTKFSPNCTPSDTQCCLDSECGEGLWCNGSNNSIFGPPGKCAPIFDCSGNNWDKVGDDNCCGAPGKIGRSGHICPKTAPSCTGYESGTWGTCNAACTPSGTQCCLDSECGEGLWCNGSNNSLFGPHGKCASIF